MSQKGYIENKNGKLRVRFGKKIQKRFGKNADAADRYLTALRYHDDQGDIDHRDHAKGAPLSIRAQAKAWLTNKLIYKPKLSAKYKHNLTTWTEQLAEELRNKNMKAIKPGDLDDFMGRRAHLSEKTRADMLRCFDQFFRWFAKREQAKMIDVPLIVAPTLGWREITDLETQAAILDEMERIVTHPKIWLGAKWLATYIAIRPCEMRRLRERDVNLNGMLVCRPETTKEKKPKLVPLLDEDMELAEIFKGGFPDHLFFRWEDDSPMHEHLFYDWWVKARNNLKIGKVGLYGGTRSTGATAAAKIHGRKKVQEYGTKHGTDKAFDRYCRAEALPSQEIYQTLANARKVVKLRNSVDKKTE